MSLFGKSRSRNGSEVLTRGQLERIHQQVKSKPSMVGWCAKFPGAPSAREWSNEGEIPCFRDIQPARRVRVGDGVATRQTDPPGVRWDRFVPLFRLREPCKERTSMTHYGSKSCLRLANPSLGTGACLGVVHIWRGRPDI